MLVFIVGIVIVWEVVSAITAACAWMLMASDNVSSVGVLGLALKARPEVVGVVGMHRGGRRRRRARRVSSSSERLEA